MLRSARRDFFSCSLVGPYLLLLCTHRNLVFWGLLPVCRCSPARPSAVIRAESFLIQIASYQALAAFLWVRDA